MSFGTTLVIIVAIITIGRIVRMKHENRMPGPFLQTGQDTARLREEVGALKERIAVLERLATDDTNAQRLDREIEKLRDRH